MSRSKIVVLGSSRLGWLTVKDATPDAVIRGVTSAPTYVRVAARPVCDDAHAAGCRPTAVAADSAKPLDEPAPSSYGAEASPGDKSALARRPQMVALRAVFIGVIAPAERRLGWWRWLLVGVTAHVVATYVGQSYLRRSISKGDAPTRLINTRDVGVSYFVFGTAGALSGYVERPWRSRWQASVLTALVANVAVRPTFTEIGHLTAFVVGISAIPTTPDRDGRPYPPHWLFTTDAVSNECG